MLQLPEPERLPLLGRTVVVDTPAAFADLALSEFPLIFVVRFKDEVTIGRSRRQGHRILVPLGADHAGGASLIVPRVARSEAEDALRAMKIGKDDVEPAVALARRSMVSFRRSIAVRPEVHQPAWAQPAAARLLVPALLVGTWNDRAAADRAIIEVLARQNYETFLDAIAPLMNDVDPPLHRVGDIWQAVSREDMWTQAARFVRREDVERLHQIATEVLGAVDPRLALPAGERWLAGIRGNVRPHSGGLCEGITETLALMGTRGETIMIGGAGSLRDAARRIVHDLLARANQNAQVWTSLARFLPLLAEAAPDEFLAAVETGLAGDHPYILALFEEEPSPLFGSSEHTGLLWALETVAWSPEHLSRATLILSKIARIDPGGKLANRPQETLRGIFLPWFPQTAATVEERLLVLDRVREREPPIRRPIGPCNRSRSVLRSCSTASRRMPTWT